MSEQTTEDGHTAERPANGGVRRTRDTNEKRRESASGSGEPKRTRRVSDAGAKSGKNGTDTRGTRVSAVQAVKKAIGEFSTLTGRAPESVIGTKWEDGHWAVRLEVVESRRIPDSADLLAEYEVELDGAGELVAYDRKDRYVRGRPSE